MAKVPGSHCVKCEVHAALAKCYENLGQTDPVITTCEAGIQVCISGASSRERSVHSYAACQQHTVTCTRAIVKYTADHPDAGRLMLDQTI